MAGVNELQENNKFTRPALGRNQDRPNLGHNLQPPPSCSPYSELGLILPSKTPADLERCRRSVGGRWREKIA